MRRNRKTAAGIFSNDGLESPDALAKITVSLHDKCIVDVKLKKEKARQDESLPADARQIKPAKDGDAVNLIWQMLNDGKIDIGYACIGYSLDGRPVLNYRNLVDLLVASGFTPADAISFIDDFALNSKKAKTSLIIMTDVNTGKILTEVKKIA